MDGWGGVRRGSHVQGVSSDGVVLVAPASWSWERGQLVFFLRGGGSGVPGAHLWTLLMQNRVPAVVTSSPFGGGAETRLFVDLPLSRPENVFFHFHVHGLLFWMAS